MRRGLFDFGGLQKTLMTFLELSCGNSGRLRKCSFKTPSTLQSAQNRHVMKAGFPSPCRQCLGSSKKRKKVVSSSVSTLFRHRNPPAVSRFVIPIHIVSFDSGTFKPSVFHILKKYRKRIPSRVDRDSSSTVTHPSNMIRVGASFSHTSPRRVNSAFHSPCSIPAMAVLCFSLFGALFLVAPARLCVPCPNPASINDAFVSANASAFKEMPSATTVATVLYSIFGNYCQTVKGFSDHFRSMVVSRKTATFK